MLLDGIFTLAGTILDKIFPNKDEAEKAKLRLFELQQQGALEELKAQMQVDLAQIAVNQEEAKSANLFVSGWRPFIGWVSGASMAYAIIVFPILDALIPGLPDLDITLIVTILSGMLGINGLSRTYEKVKGVAIQAIPK